MLTANDSGFGAVYVENSLNVKRNVLISLCNYQPAAFISALRKIKQERFHFKYYLHILGA